MLANKLADPLFPQRQRRSNFDNLDPRAVLEFSIIFPILQILGYHPSVSVFLQITKLVSNFILSLNSCDFQRY
jgi:hypothetical protein